MRESRNSAWPGPASSDAVWSMMPVGAPTKTFSRPAGEGQLGARQSRSYRSFSASATRPPGPPRRTARRRPGRRGRWRCRRRSRRWPAVSQRPDHAGRVGGPAGRPAGGQVVQVAARRTPPARCRQCTRSRPSVRRDAAADRRVRQREGQHEAVVVVGVLADEVDPARAPPTRRPARPPNRSRNCAARRSPGAIAPGRTAQASATMPAGPRGRAPAQLGSRAVAAEATRTAGSPARRGATTSGIGWPVTSRTVSMTSRTEKPLPLPRLQIRCSPGRRPPSAQQVGLGQVGDVDVVADAGAVRGRVVVAEDGDRLAAGPGATWRTSGMRCDSGSCRSPLRAVRAGHVEVAQARPRRARAPAHSPVIMWSTASLEAP